MCSNTRPCITHDAVFSLQARVNVPDDRYKWLVDLYKPKSAVPAFLEVVDIAGLVKYATASVLPACHTFASSDRNRPHPYRHRDNRVP